MSTRTPGGPLWPTHKRKAASKRANKKLAAVQEARRFAKRREETIV